MLSTYRFRFLAVGTANFMSYMFLCMSLLTAGYWYKQFFYSPLLSLVIHATHLLAILILRWLYETPLETVREAARFAGGPSGKRQMVLNPDGIRCYSKDFCFYTKAGTIISVAFAHWAFWTWVVLPGFLCVTIPLGIIGAIYVWRCRMVLLGPGYRFAWDIEAESAAAGYCWETFNEV